MFEAIVHGNVTAATQIKNGVQRTLIDACSSHRACPKSLQEPKASRLPPLPQTHIFTTQHKGNRYPDFDSPSRSIQPAASVWIHVRHQIVDCTKRPADDFKIIRFSKNASKRRNTKPSGLKPLPQTRWLRRMRGALVVGNQRVFRRFCKNKGFGTKVPPTKT